MRWGKASRSTEQVGHAYTQQFSVSLFLWEITHDTWGISHQTVTEFRLSMFSCYLAKRGCHVLTTATNSTAGSFEWRDPGPVSCHAGGVSMRLRGALASTFQYLHFQWHDTSDVSNKNKHLTELLTQYGTILGLNVVQMWGSGESINNVTRPAAGVVLQANASQLA